MLGLDHHRRSRGHPAGRRRRRLARLRPVQPRRRRARSAPEIELAANRKPYYDDETLEGRRLERVQLLGVAAARRDRDRPAAVLAARARAARPVPQEGLEKRLASWGAELSTPPPTVGFNCAGCHGGMNADRRRRRRTRSPIRTPARCRRSTWKAPALNTVLYRFGEDEVRFILKYGRPFSPMSAWGLAGGGPMNEQQIQTLIEYLKSIQIPREDCSEEEADDPLCESGHLPGGDPGRHRGRCARQARRGRHVRQLRRGAVQPRALERRLQLRPLPHPGLELRRPRRARPGRVRLEPHRRLDERPRSRPSTT